MRFLTLLLLAACSAAAAARFPDRSTKPPLLPESQLEIVGALPHRPGNLDVDPLTQRLIFTFHPMDQPPTPTVCKVCELHANGTFRPFADQSLFSTVLSVRVSPLRRLLYALDHKNLGQDQPPVLYQFDLLTEQLVREFPFSNAEVAPRLGNLNDFVLTKDENFAIIADVGIGNQRAGLIVVNLVTGEMHRALDQHESTRAKPFPGMLGLSSSSSSSAVLNQLGVDSIGISPDGNIVYFGAVFDPYMWMVPTAALVVVGAGSLPEERVDVAFPKPASDGIVVDEDSGVVFVTDIEHSAIWMTHPEQHGRRKTLVRSERLLRWPDGLSIASSGGSKRYLYITASAVGELLKDGGGGGGVGGAPFHILRIDVSGDLGFAGTSSNRHQGEEPVEEDGGIRLEL